MGWYLGIDTSNYTTSVAAFHRQTGKIIQCKKKLSVQEGKLGLRQSEAVFAHILQLYNLVEETTRQSGTFVGVGVSVTPRRLQGSYMPCFLAGELAGKMFAAGGGLPLSSWSHQEGHFAAALFGTNQLELLNESFVAFHLSGGTTDCVLVENKNRKMEITPLYQSLDLFAGQGVDRVGKMLGLAFPSGEELDILGQESQKVFHPKVFFRNGNPSISGLENQCQELYLNGEKPKDIAKYCFDYLGSMVDVMTTNVKKKYPRLPVVYAGGVMANTLIRQRITEKHGGHFAPPEFSADNAAGIAVLAAYNEERRRTNDLNS